MRTRLLPPETELDLLNKLINWYNENKPEAGKRIHVKKGPRDLRKMLGFPSSIDAATEYEYRGRTIVAVGKDRERD